MDVVTAAVVVVGTGPAGVSVAWPLVEAGLDVVLVDGGSVWRTPSPLRPALAEARGRPDAARFLLGERGEGLRAKPGTSPKIRTSMPAGAVETYLAANSIVTENFTAVGSLALGGLSNIWGAGASAFGDRDLAGWPVSAAELLSSYQRVAGRIGISGSLTDGMSLEHGTGWPVQDPLPLGVLTANILRRYNGAKKGIVPFQLGRARLAVLTRDLSGREACTLDNFCMWRCSRRAIYSAADDLRDLAALPNVRLFEKTVVKNVRATSDGWRVTALRNSGDTMTFDATRVVLAAGVLPSTRLVLDAVPTCGPAVRLLTTPATTVISLDYASLGAAWPTRGVALGNLAMALPLPDGRQAFGTVFPADGLAAGDLVAGTPLSTSGGLKILRAVGPSLIATLLFLPGDYSRHTASLEREADGTPRLRVRGAWAAELPAVMRAAVRSVTAGLRRLGCISAPWQGRLLPAGSESHYAGTLPMGRLTTAEGEVIGAKGLYVADASTFPSLPAKSHTFTAMANADRIGRLMVQEQ